MYNKLHLSGMTSAMTPTDRRTVKISSHKDNISHYFTCFQYNPMLLQPKHCLASVSANRVINIHIFTKMRWETHWWTHIFTHTGGSTRTPQREISWLLKYNYLTAGWRLGWCLDRLFLSVFLIVFLFVFFLFFLCLFSAFLLILVFPVTECFPSSASFSPTTHLSSLKHCLADPVMLIWFNLQVFYWHNFQYQLPL